MDCSQFEKILHDLDRLGTEGFAVRESALAHAESCSHCARLMTDAETLDGALKLLAESEGGRQAPAGLETILLEEFRRLNAAASRQRVQRQIAALGVAAALLLAVGFSLRHRVVHTPGAAPPANVVVKVPSRAIETPIGASVGSQAQEGLAESQSGAAESAAAFTPLPYADDPAALEDGAVVRVQISRAALASFGLPVAAMEIDGPVSADLIVSADGTPQAIRLVPQDAASQEF